MSLTISLFLLLKDIQFSGPCIACPLSFFFFSADTGRFQTVCVDRLLLITVIFAMLLFIYDFCTSARGQKIGRVQFVRGSVKTSFVRSTHSSVDTALKQADMMNHVHDRAMSNGHILTPCHVDLLHSTVTCLRMMRSS